MTNKIHQETRAPSGPGDLSKMVADLIQLSSDCVSEYDISTCSLKIKELTMYLNNPTGPAQPISQVLGKLTLLYEQRAKLQLQAHAEELIVMQAACRAEQVSNSHLRQENETLRTQARDKHEQSLQECKTLRTQPPYEHEMQEREAQHVQVPGQDSQLGLATHKLLPVSITNVSLFVTSRIETLGEQLRAQLRKPQAEEAVLWQISHLQRRSTLTNARCRVEQASTTRSVVTWEYQATPKARLADAEDLLQTERSSNSVRLTPSSLPRGDRIPLDPKSLGSKSPPGFPLTGRDNSFLASYLSDSDTDFYDTCSLSSRTHFVTNILHPTMHDTFFSAQLSNGGTSTSPDVVAPPPQPERPVTGNARAQTSQSPRFELLEFLAKNIEQFGPDNCDKNSDNYFREHDPSLKEVPKATKEEKTLRLVLKTSSTAVHKFLQSLPSSVTSNFHPRIYTHVLLMTQQGKHSLQKIRKMSQVVWETVVTLKAAVGATEPVELNTRLSNSSAPSKCHPPHKTRGVRIHTSPTIREDLGIRTLLSREVGIGSHRTVPPDFFKHPD